MLSALMVSYSAWVPTNLMYTAPYRFARYFGTTAAFWMTLQDKYELEQASDALGDEMERIGRVAFSWPRTRLAGVGEVEPANPFKAEVGDPIAEYKDASR